MARAAASKLLSMNPTRMDLAAMGNTRRRSITWAVIYLDGSKVSTKMIMREARSKVKVKKTWEC